LSLKFFGDINVVKIESVCIPSKNLNKSVDFWSNLIGLKVKEKYDNQIIVSDGNVELVLDGEKLADVEIVLGYSSDEFKAVLEKIEQQNIEIARPLKDWGGPLGLEITIKDPSGNPVCVHKLT